MGNEINADVIRRITNRVYESLGDNSALLGRALQTYTEYLSSQVESPIELLFGVGWRAWQLTQFIAISAEASAIDFVGELLFHARPQTEVRLEGQVRRVDFSIEVLGSYQREKSEPGLTPIPPVAVELDGYDFHERTKEQVQERNNRDRQLQAAGWIVFHFSGTELYRNPIECAEEVAEFLIAQYTAWLERRKAVRQPEGRADNA